MRYTYDRIANHQDVEGAATLETHLGAQALQHLGALIEQHPSIAGTAPKGQSAKRAGRHTPEPLRHDGENLTDMGNLQRLLKRHGNSLRYMPALKEWRAWDGTVWVSSAGRVQKYAEDTVASIHAEADACQHPSTKGALQKFAYASEAGARIRTMIDLARAHVEARPEEFDTDTMLLSVLNGTMDLRTGEPREHRREDMMTKLVPIVHDPNARAPRWEQFVRQIMGEDKESNVPESQSMARYLQRVAGLALTGAWEKTFWIFYGAGDNGKSLFLDTLRMILGPYGHCASFQTFVARPSAPPAPDPAAAS